MTSSIKTVTPAEVDHIAHLAQLPVTALELKKLTQQLVAILTFIGKLKELDTKGIAPTNQVTGLENIFREDVVSTSLTQAEALVAAPNTYKGYFKVKAVFEEI